MPTEKEYDRIVNSRWPSPFTPIDSEQEARTGLKRLWRKATGFPFKGKIQIVSGNRVTWCRPQKGYRHLYPRSDFGLDQYKIKHGLQKLVAKRWKNYCWVINLDATESQGSHARDVSGWNGLVHMVSHFCGDIKYGQHIKPHGNEQLRLERDLTIYCLDKGFHLGSLKSKKEKLK